MSPSSSKKAQKMDSIDETSVLESSSSIKMATEDLPSRSVDASASSSDSALSISSEALHKQLRLIEDAEIANTISRSQRLQEEVLENRSKPVPSLVFKYVLICMGLCGVLIGIVLGAIIGQHLLTEHQNPRYMEPSDGWENHTQAPTGAPGLDWYYAPTPRPSSPDIFDHNHSSPVRTLPPTVANSSTLMPTENSSSVNNETSVEATWNPVSNRTDYGDLGQVDEHVNDTNIILP